MFIININIQKDDITLVVKYKNATIRFHGEPPENFKEITKEFLKKVWMLEIKDNKNYLVD